MPDHGVHRVHGPVAERTGRSSDGRPQGRRHNGVDCIFRYRLDHGTRDLCFVEIIRITSDQAGQAIARGIEITGRESVSDIARRPPQCSASRRHCGRECCRAKNASRHEANTRTQNGVRDSWGDAVVVVTTFEVGHDPTEVRDRMNGRGGLLEKLIEDESRGRAERSRHCEARHQ
jgi:hypothetical protein